MQNKFSFLQQNYLALVLLILIVGIPSYMIYHYRIMSPTDNDYSMHIQITENYLENGYIPPHYLSHPILQIGHIGFLWLSRSRINPWESTILMMTVSNILLALSIYFWFVPKRKPSNDFARVFWAITLTFITPIMIFAFLDGRYYFGYIGLANYHNPTIQLLRPCAVLLFILALRIFSNSKNQFWVIGLSAFITVFTTLIKPNLAICLIPALMIMGSYFLIKKKKIDWKLWLFGFLIPAICTLLWQYGLSYAGVGEVKERIVFAPFMVESAFSGYILLKFFASILFPLVCLITFGKTIAGKIEIKLAWLIFMIGAIQVYFFAEGRSTLLDGNFRWSAQIALLLLFITSARFVFQHWEELKSVSLKEKIIIYSAYLPHVVGGIVYYIYCLLTTKYS